MSQAPRPPVDALPAAPAGRSGWPWTAVGGAPRSEDCGPRITIVTPNLNGGAFLEEAIRSVLLQAYPDLEYFVMDGGSSDGSADIIRRYERWLTGWVSSPDAGQSDAINQGFARATGEILGWLCSDDLLEAGALCDVGRYFATHDGCRWLSGHGDFVWLENGRRWQGQAGIESPEALVEFWLYGGPGHFIPQASCFFSASLWQEVGGLRNDLHSAMDYDLWLRMEEVASLEVLDRLLSVSRLHAGAKTVRFARERVESSAECALAAVTRRGGRPRDLLFRMFRWATRWRLGRLKACVRARAARSALSELVGLACAGPRVLSTRGRVALFEASHR